MPKCYRHGNFAGHYAQVACMYAMLLANTIYNHAISTMLQNAWSSSKLDMYQLIAPNAVGH